MRYGGSGGSFGGYGILLTNASFTGNITGATKMLAASAIPFIHISSGSIAANGAISAITALPRAYPHAYCYFPANALATTIAAGWHYCTFSTTTAGVAYLDTYTSGVPSIPASPTAVTDGKGVYTGDTSERTAQSITVAGGSMGANGLVRIHTRNLFTAAANNKNTFVKFGGTTFHTVAGYTTQVGEHIQTVIQNSNSQSVQEGSSVGADFSSTARHYNGTGTVDSSADVAITWVCQKATATSNGIVANVIVEVGYNP